MSLEVHDVDLLLADLRTAVRRDHGRRRRRRGAAMAAVLLGCLVGSIAVAGTYEDWWTGNSAAVHEPQVAEAMEESTIGPIQPDLSKKATVARTARDELVAVATKNGGFCLSAFRDGDGLGSSCSSETAKPDGAASVFETRASTPLDAHGEPLPAERRYWVAYGRITDEHAAAIDLSSVGLTSTVRLERGGFFLFDIPEGSWSSLDRAHGPVAILDSSGKTIRTACVAIGVAPGKAWSGGGTIGERAGDCRGYDPAPPRPDMSKAVTIAEHTLVNDAGVWTAGTTIALWHVPLADGRVCSFWALPSPQPQLDTDANGVPVSVPNGAHPGACAKPGSWPFPRSTSITAGLASAWSHGRYTMTVQGQVRPGSGIVGVAVVAADGTRYAATTGGDEYLAELPSAPRVGKAAGPIPGGPYTVVGYDANGHEVASTPLHEH